MYKYGTTIINLKFHPNAIYRSLCYNTMCYMYSLEESFEYIRNLTCIDEITTCYYAFIHWIKDLLLESVHWNFKSRGQIHVWTRLLLGSCGMLQMSQAHKVPMAVHSSIAHQVFVWFMDRFFMISSLLGFQFFRWWSQGLIWLVNRTLPSHVCWCWESLYGFLFMLVFSAIS